MHSLSVSGLTVFCIVPQWAVFILQFLRSLANTSVVTAQEVTVGRAGTSCFKGCNLITQRGYH